MPDVESNGVHAGLGNFAPDKELGEYDLYDFWEERADYDKQPISFFDGTYTETRYH